jgi:hypothetical protein
MNRVLPLHRHQASAKIINIAPNSLNCVVKRVHSRDEIFLSIFHVPILPKLIAEVTPRARHYIFLVCDNAKNIDNIFEAICHSCAQQVSGLVEAFTLKNHSNSGTSWNDRLKERLERGKVGILSENFDFVNVNRFKALSFLEQIHEVGKYHPLNPQAVSPQLKCNKLVVTYIALPVCAVHSKHGPSRSSNGQDACNERLEIVDKISKRASATLVFNNPRVAKCCRQQDRQNSNDQKKDQNFDFVISPQLIAPCAATRLEMSHNFNAMNSGHVEVAA